MDEFLCVLHLLAHECTFNLSCMKTNIPACICISFYLFLSCSPNKKTQDVVESKSAKKSIYTSIHRIAEELPFTQQEASDFFSNLDSLHSRSFRNAQGQQFQYRNYTIFYAQPTRGKKLRGVGIDLDSSSCISREQLGQQLNARWHSANLIEVKAGRVHYTADYVDSKKLRKVIHITTKIASPEDESITFIGIDMEPEKKALD